MKRIIAALAVLFTLGAVGAGDASEADAKLATALAHAREQRLADLAEYAEKGVYPHNHGHEGQRIPYFMDRHGRLCAVGYLIAKSMAGKDWDYGRFMGLKNVARTSDGVGISMRGDNERRRKAQEDAERFRGLLGFFDGIAAADVNVRIKDVHDGPVLDWILRSGLTQEEAALIQPGYSYLACDACLPGSEAKRKTFGRQTPESQAVEERDRVRIRAHLKRVDAVLRRDAAKSLRACAERLRARWPQGPWTLEPSRL